MIIKTFTNPTLGMVRVLIDEQGRAWVCAKDMCVILGYKNTTVTVQYRIQTGKMLKGDVLQPDGDNSPQYVNERGVYALTAKTQRKDRNNALALRNWLISDVLHNIDTSKDPKQESLTFENKTDVSLVAQDDVQEFEHPQFGKIRVLTKEQNEALFNLKDLCTALGHTNYRKAMKDLLDSEDVTRGYTLTNGGRQLMLYVNESGLYALMLGSKLPNLRPFKHWVTAEVLPSIRKYGIYMAPAEEKEYGEFANIIRNLQEQSMQKDRIIAELQRRVDLQRMDNMKQTNTINQLKELTFAQTLLLDEHLEDEENAELGRYFKAAPKHIKVGLFAKSIGGFVKYKGQPIGRNIFFDWLRRHVECHHETYGGSSYNVALQTAINADRLRVFWEPDKNTGELRPITYVTPKGKEFYTNWFMNAKGDKPTYDVYYDELDENGELITGVPLCVDPIANN